MLPRFPPLRSELSGRKRPHKHRDPAFLVPRPKTKGIPNTVFGRILVFMCRLGPKACWLLCVGTGGPSPAHRMPLSFRLALGLLLPQCRSLFWGLSLCVLARMSRRESTKDLHGHVQLGGTIAGFGCRLQAFGPLQGSFTSIRSTLKILLC